MLVRSYKIKRQTGECKYNEAIIHIESPSCEDAEKDPPDERDKWDTEEDTKCYLESKI